MSRPREDRITDTRGLLAEEQDLWLATTATDAPYMIPLSCLFTSDYVVMATRRASQTTANIEYCSIVRAAVGSPTDVVIVDGTAAIFEIQDRPADVERFAARCFDPETQEHDYVLLLRPDRIQAWHSEVELAGRTIMLNGTWLGDAPIDQ